VAQLGYAHTWSAKYRDVWQQEEFAAVYACRGRSVSAALLTVP
jgi:hypothetical protein